LVKSVEIVTGGASAAYGSDAVAGVVNFVLDKKYQGIKVLADSGITERATVQITHSAPPSGRPLAAMIAVICC
jgi:outer membrane receptor protein involved in Fe transport